MNPWRAVRVVSDACRITRRLDDRVRGGSMRDLDAGALQEQSEIDAALADRRATPWRSPGSALRIDVMTAIEARRNGHVRGAAGRRTSGAGSRVATWGVAAAVAVAAGLAALDSLRREAASPSGPAAVESNGPMMGLAFDMRPVLADRMDEPLRREAMALRDDTSRAARVLMDSLTLESEAAPR